MTQTINIEEFSRDDIFDTMIKRICRNGANMPTNIEKLIAAAKKVNISPADREAQRRSFAYGNTNIENRRITRKMVDEQADAIKLEACHN